MFAPFIIDQVRQREQARRSVPEQLQIELPPDSYRPRAPSQPPEKDDRSERGVTVIDLCPSD